MIRWFKKLVIIIILIMVTSMTSTKRIYAGQKEWATAGKVITGIILYESIFRPIIKGLFTPELEYVVVCPCDHQYLLKKNVYIYRYYYPTPRKVYIYEYHYYGYGGKHGK